MLAYQYPSCALPRPGYRRLRPWPSASAKHGSVVGGARGSLSGYGLPAFFISLSCRAKGYNQQCTNRELYKHRHKIRARAFNQGVGSNRKSWDTSRGQTTLAERFCPELELSQLECESSEGRPRMTDFRIAGSPKSKIHQNESCSRDRVLSNQPCPTGRLRLEVPKWIELCSRGNLGLPESYYNPTMLFRHAIFGFF